MNGKSFVVITLFVVACSFASAQTFGFASVGGGQYCNYEQLIPGGGNTYGGIDNLSACGLSIDSVIAGFGTKLDATDSNGYTVSGAGVTYGDSIYSVVDGDNQSEWAVWTSLTTSKQKDGIFHGKLGWVWCCQYHRLCWRNQPGLPFRTAAEQEGLSSDPGYRGSY